MIFKVVSSVYTVMLVEPNIYTQMQKYVNSKPGMAVCTLYLLPVSLWKMCKNKMLYTSN
jgi:hypothetical protein